MMIITKQEDEMQETAEMLTKNNLLETKNNNCIYNPA